MRVPAPTSAPGYRSFSQVVTSSTQLEGYAPVVSQHTRVTALHNRPTLIKGTPPLATDYYRKVGKLTSLQAVDLHDQKLKRKVKADASYPWFTLASAPYGTSYTSGTVGIPTWMTDKVIQDAIIDAHGITANILEDLAQAKSTLQLAADVFSLVGRLWLAFFRGHWKQLYKLLKETGLPESIAASWLAFYYGIKPLVGTLDAILQTEPRFHRRKVRKRVSVKVDAAPFLAEQRGTYDFLSQDANMSAECSLLIETRATDDMVYWQSLGLTSNLWNDAMVTAWALVPFSFVVDWFLPVERFLRTRVWDSNMTLKAGHVGRKLSCRAVAQRNTSGVTYVGNAVGMWPKVLVESLQYNRAAYNDFPPPSGLSFHVSLNPNRLFSAAALLTLFTSTR